MENKDKQREVKEAACALLKRLSDASSSLKVSYDDKKAEAVVPAELQRYLVTCLRSLCATGPDQPAEDKNCIGRGFQIGNHRLSAFIYRNGVVNIYRDKDLLAAADLRNPCGELEEKAFAMFGSRLLDSLRIFI